MKLITIVGARPQFIKAAAVSRAFNEFFEIEEIIIHTGQHFDANMSDVFFEELHIPKPHYNLAINSLSHGAMTGRMMESIEAVILKEKPDYVLVYGDTNSTIAGALAAKKLHVKVVHVEAGLRSFNTKMPEEINRILTDRISDVLFCPTNEAVKNLNNEGFQNIDCQIIKNGDVMQDAALYYKDLAKKPSFDLPEEFVLLTMHRAENTDDLDKLKNIISALNSIHQKMPVFWLIHPRTKQIINSQSIDVKFHVFDPVGYLEMIYLLEHCSLVMTDSGGLQKEAFFFSKNCVTLREETEWVELIEGGFNVLVGSDVNKINEGFDNMSKKQNDFSVDLYGKGQASRTIASQLITHKKAND
ncbi:MAG: UDP-N-acetylglucosamine 2-epimerase (non-hydrolyzing) [Flavobacteriaceae bacterium]|nr:UDP-N-acetylglucosamine 2-epimerase (non-hydrolyzing) [Flavobacteriaceae bacterium]